MRYALICLFFTSRLLAGDAVAIGYNADGVWTALTYYNSSNPKGGKDYKTEKEARDDAVRDLRSRSPEGLARSEILASSDSTGYTAVGRGENKAGKDVNVIGRGKSQAEADQQALAKLKEAGFTKKDKIVYRYFSYGADSQ